LEIGQGKIISVVFADMLVLRIAFCRDLVRILNPGFTAGYGLKQS
jgi:hypothetical protein